MGACHVRRHARRSATEQGCNRYSECLCRDVPDGHVDEADNPVRKGVDVPSCIQRGGPDLPAIERIGPEKAWEIHVVKRVGLNSPLAVGA